MDKCRYCGKSLDKRHLRVGFISGPDRVTESWECEETGQRFKRELEGQAAAEAQKEYGSRKYPREKNSGKDDSLWGSFVKILKIFIRFI